jgi:hypothetical protein
MRKGVELVLVSFPALVPKTEGATQKASLSSIDTQYWAYCDGAVAGRET